MESSTGSSEDSSLCGLRGISLFIHQYPNQIQHLKETIDITEEHNSSEELQGTLDDGNIK